MGNPMSLEQKNSTDEIDLLDLLLQLWNGKKTIITTVCIAIVLAIGYLAVMDIDRDYYTTTARAVSRLSHSCGCH